jgi:hypothetical protein
VGEFLNIDPRLAEAAIKASELRRQWDAEQWELLRRQLTSPTPTLGLSAWPILRPTALQP